MKKITVLLVVLLGSILPGWTVVYQANKKMAGFSLSSVYVFYPEHSEPLTLSKKDLPEPMTIECPPPHQATASDEDLWNYNHKQFAAGKKFSQVAVGVRVEGSRIFTCKQWMDEGVKYTAVTEMPPFMESDYSLVTWEVREIDYRPGAVSGKDFDSIIPYGEVVYSARAKLTRHFFLMAAVWAILILAVFGILNKKTESRQ